MRVARALRQAKTPGGETPAIGETRHQAAVGTVTNGRTWEFGIDVRTVSMIGCRGHQELAED
jgi:hypothetical protein